MIATWDKDHTPDVMMAAWAGQLDYTQIVISLSQHKTTENLALTKAFTVSFADERTVAYGAYRLYDLPVREWLKKKLFS